MTTETTAKPRQAADSPREMPVLFHLIDVRPKSGSAGRSAPKSEPVASKSAPPAAKVEEKPVAPPAAAVVAPPPAPVVEPTTSMKAPVIPPSEVITEQLVASKHVELPEVVSVEKIASVAAPVVPPAIKPAESIASAAPKLEQPAAENTTSTLPVATSVATSAMSSMVESATEAAKSPASEPTAEVPSAESRRKRSEAREQRAAVPPKSESWFSTHGRNIGLVFVVALAATVYYARSGGPSKQPPSSQWPAAHPGEAASLEAPTIEIPEAGESQESMGPPALVSEQPAMSSPASVYSAEGVSPASDVQLGAPELTGADSAPPVGDERGLFPWNPAAQQPVAEVASRPETPPATSPTSPAVAPAAPPATPPVVYPTTGRGGNYAPPLAPPANAPGNTYGNAAPTNVEPRLGNRYERSGSGLY